MSNIIHLPPDRLSALTAGTLTEVNGSPIVWSPTDKQREFLSAAEDEVLFGGAAGGGKSDSLVIDALGLQQEAIAKPHYRGILFRRSFPELRELIDRSRELYPQIIHGATFKEAEKLWVFPSGAKLEYGYLESEKDRYRYQGRQYQYIGWDELTHWMSPVAYDYLLSRLRSPDPTITCYVRATTNPGGAGHDWVQQRWQITDDGGPSLVRVQVGATEITRRFIPAKLDDNPYLADSGYRERLSTLSEMERRALLDGRWDVVEILGAIYNKELERLYTSGRVCNIPIETFVPVNTFWDLGMNDTTAIWFHQQVGLEHRFIDYYEANGAPLQHYVQMLKEKGYTYGEHYLPHDVEVVELGSGFSRKRMLMDHGLRDIITVPRVRDVNHAIEQTKQVFGRCWFDKVRCERGLAALKNYRREFDEKNQVFRMRPLHNWASNGSDAFRQFATGYRLSSNSDPLPHELIPEWAEDF